MEKLRQTLAGVGGALLLIFAVVASITLNSTSFSLSDNNDSGNSSAPSSTTTTTKPPETTPATTKPQTTTPVTTKAPETTVPVTTEPLEWGEETVSGTMYVVQSCYSRARAIIGSDTVRQYSYGDAVNVVAVTDTGYYRLDNGEYIHGDYLTENAL